MARFTVNMISYTLGRTVDITVIIPTVTIPESFGLMMGGPKPSHEIKDKYPVLYLLHGMGNNHAQWTGYANAELFAEERQIAIVMASGENKAYKQAKDGDDFFTFFAEELPEFVKNMFPVSTRPEDTYIAGLSMGGYGSLLHGLSHPERFAAIGSFSGAVHGMSMDATLPDESDMEYPPNLLSKAVKAGTKLPPFYIACGAKDFLYEHNLAFVDELKKANAEVTWVELPEYGHEWRFWNIQLEEFLKWIPRTDSYAKNGPRQV